MAMLQKVQCGFFYFCCLCLLKQGLINITATNVPLKVGTVPVNGDAYRNGMKSRRAFGYVHLSVTD
jgi:hypothetical protein